MTHFRSLLNSIKPAAIAKHNCRPVPPSSPKKAANSRRSPIKASHTLQPTRNTAATTTTSNKTNNSAAIMHTAAEISERLTRSPSYSFHMPEMTQHVTIKGAQHKDAASQDPAPRDPASRGRQAHSDNATPSCGESKSADSRASKAARPSSANRFRRMVNECRDEP